MKYGNKIVQGLLCMAMAAVFCGISGQPSVYQWKNVAIRGGGFVPGLVFSTVQKGMLYARTDMAGAYRWDDANRRWIPLMDWLTRADVRYIGVESIAADPVDSNTVYMAIGTYTSGGNGLIVKSTDRGATWTRYNIAVPMGGNDDGRSVGERLMIDPNNNRVLFFASRTVGLWKSMDAGAIWNRVTTFPTTGISGLGLSFVTFDRKSGAPGKGSSTLYVGICATAPGSNLFRSVDSGATWTLVTGSGGPSGQMPCHGVFGPNGVLWLACNNGQPPSNATSGAVWKYNPAADAWKNVNPSGHGGGIGAVSVSAIDSNYAVAATIDWWNPDEIYRTTDGGTSWTGIGRSAQHDVKGALYLCFGQSPCSGNNIKYSGWCGDIEIDPFNRKRVFYVTGQGNWCSENADTETVNRIVWSFENVNFEETVGLDLTSSVKKAVFAVVGDIGIQRFPTTALDTPALTGMAANPVYTNGNGIDFAGLNPDIVGGCGTGNQTGSYSTDNGLTWTPFPNQAGGTKIAVSADGSTFVWGQRYSRNRGGSWTSCSGLPSGARVGSDRVNPAKFYAFSGGTLYTSTDSGKTFAAATRGLSGSGRVSAVFGLEGEVWAAASGGNLYHSKNSGANASPVSGVSTVYSVGFGKAAPGATYPSVYVVGTSNGMYGVFRSIDQGASWVRINDDNHQYGQIDNIAGDEDVYGRVYLTTQGRGIPYGMPASTAIIPSSYRTQAGSGMIRRIGDRLTVSGHGGLVLLDLRGRTVRRGTIREGWVELDLSGLRKGIYLATCDAGVKSIAVY